MSVNWKVPDNNFISRDMFSSRAVICESLNSVAIVMPAPIIEIPIRAIIMRVRRMRNGFI
ncbi:hypothetical protein D3C86_1720020 [compost metagenome]